MCPTFGGKKDPRESLLFHIAQTLRGMDCSWQVRDVTDQTVNLPALIIVGGMWTSRRELRRTRIPHEKRSSKPLRKDLDLRAASPPIVLTAHHFAPFPGKVCGDLFLD